MFYPIAIETAGTWDDMAIELVQEIGRRTTIITQDTRETVFLFQRLSIALQRGECGLLPQHNEHRIRSRRSRCFCLVFTPSALCWWAKKIIVTSYRWVGHFFLCTIWVGKFCSRQFLSQRISVAIQRFKAVLLRYCLFLCRPTTRISVCSKL